MAERTSSSPSCASSREPSFPLPPPPAGGYHNAVTHSDKSGAPGPGVNLPEFSVGELSAALRRTVEDAFGHVRVRGEVSGFKRAASGHLYMSLKDEDAVLDAVCWRGVAGRLAIAPEDGMEVIVTGRLTTYASRSRYQIVTESVELAGEGALLKLLEDRRKRLAAEGLFDADRRRALPFLPRTIGVVTSPTGAVIRDILHRLAERFPRHVLVWPVPVQGEGAAERIAAAIDGFNRLPAGGPVPRPDLLIVARGGGSLEDLWAFNEEIVVRAAAASEIPLISAVGHETDTTLIDFAADLRAPTPTAAAEKAVPVREELRARLLDDGRRMVAGSSRLLQERRVRLEGLARGLPEPRALMEAAAQRLDDRAGRLVAAMRGILREGGQNVARHTAALGPGALRREVAAAAERLAALAARTRPAVLRQADAAGARLTGLGALLESLSFRRVLERGFVLVRDGDGNPLTLAAETRPGMAVGLRFADGEVGAAIDGAAAARPRPRKRRKPDGDDNQGSLL